jgi:hypothetical protein
MMVRHARDQSGGELSYLLSPALLAEYSAVLSRPKLLKLHGLPPEDIDRILKKNVLTG